MESCRANCVNPNKFNVDPLKVDESALRVPAFFETSARLNHLVPCDQSMQNLQKNSHTNRRWAACATHPEPLPVSHACATGQVIRGVLLAIIRRPGVLQACPSALGSNREDVGPTHDSIKDAVAQLVSATSIDPLQSEVHNCTLCADLLSAWARFSCDPDTDVVSWLTEGAPTGDSRSPLQMGIFPERCHFDSRQQCSRILTSRPPSRIFK